MTILALFLSLTVGFLSIQFFAKAFNIYEKIGFSFILGIFYQSFLLFLISLVGIPVSLSSSIIISTLLIAVFLFLNFRADKKAYQFSFQEQDKVKTTFGWFLMVGVATYLIYGAATKCLFWPIAEYDSMTGYDLMAKMIAKEGSFNTSIFQYPFSNAYEIARFIYPPLVASGFAYFYLFGALNAKIYTLCLFVSFVLAFYGLLRKKTSDTVSIFITLLMLVTPEMFSHVSLGLTNLPNAIYTSLSFICLFYWLESRSNSYYIASLLLMAASMWSRSDSIVFVAGYGLVFLFDYFKTKEWLKPLIYVVSCFFVFMIWNLFIKINVGANSSDFFVKYLFWDGVKFGQIFSKAFDLMLGSGTLYGITFYVFVIFLALNIVDIVRKIDLLVVFTVSTWLLYTFLFYQIDYGFAGSIEAYLNASYKRGLFNFVPLAWFFVAVSPMSSKWLGKLDLWLLR